jgi:hypothetical protein
MSRRASAIDAADTKMAGADGWTTPPLMIEKP